MWLSQNLQGLQVAAAFFLVVSWQVRFLCTRVGRLTVCTPPTTTGLIPNLQELRMTSSPFANRPLSAMR
jgi:hypothetical protein